MPPTTKVNIAGKDSTVMMKHKITTQVDKKKGVKTKRK